MLGAQGVYEPWEPLNAERWAMQRSTLLSFFLGTSVLLIIITGDFPSGRIAEGHNAEGVPFEKLQQQVDVLATQIQGLAAQIDALPSPTPQIAFLVSLSTDFPVPPATTPNPLTTVPFDNVILNDGDGYTSPAFTAPVSGVYHVAGILIVEEGTNATLLLVHQNALGFTERTYVLSNKITSSDVFRLSGSLTLELAGGDSIRLSLANVNNPRSVLGETDVSTMNSFFSGHLVYAKDS